MNSALLAITISTTTANPEVARKLTDAVRGLTDGTEETAVESLYWWDGAVARDWEILLTFRTKADFADVCAALEPFHDYDVPMIAGVEAEPGDEGGSSPYWRAEIGSLHMDEASKLIEERICACVQMLPDGRAFAKTTAEGKHIVEERQSSVIWTPLQANGSLQCQGSAGGPIPFILYMFSVAL